MTESLCRIKSSRQPSAALCRHVASWGAFALSLIAYLLTLAPSASYWDCPEYILSAFRLEPGHPPGNPFWTLTARFFTILFGSPQRAALAVNLSSALSMAAAAGLLASSIFIILRRTILRRHSPIVTAAASLAGALCFGWADSPWYSAVEAEVYALSMLFTALSFRLMLTWAFLPDRRRARRYLLLIIYLTGLSIGVHQLNLLVIPALALVWLFRRHRRRAPWRTLLMLLLSFAIVGAILLLFMPGVIAICARTQPMCVNDLGLPFHSGVWIAWAIMLILAALLPLCAAKARLGSRLRLAAWAPLLLLIGYSAYFTILIRGAANTPINEAAPSDIFALALYQSRDQYGSTPLFYGPTPYSRPLYEERIDSAGHASYPLYAKIQGKPLYTRDTASYRPGNAPEYVRYGEKSKFRYPPELNMFLPRMTSGDPEDIEAYGDWAGMTPAAMDTVMASFAIDSLGQPVGRLGDDGTRSKSPTPRPTYLQQLQYLLGYQISYMYLRYMMWNFCGRQNDRASVGEVEHGNFITGIPPLDTAMLGPQSAMPDEIGRDNPGRNVYFAIPLIFGILGILALSDKHSLAARRWNFVIFILFFMTGIAIVLYLNQSPREPRERDYSFLGSMWAYAIWIAAGMAWLWRIAAEKGMLARRLRVPPKSFVAAVCLATPIWMLAQNFDDHDRSERHAAADYAANLLNSLDRDAIIFVNGDNYTFPLWYAQEVLGLRRDVSIINTAYLSTPWYAIQLMRPGEVSLPVRMQASPEDLAYNNFSYIFYKSLPALPDSAGLDVTAGGVGVNAKAVDAVAALREVYAVSQGRPSLAPLLSIPFGMDTVTLEARQIAEGRTYMPAASLFTLDIIASNAASPHPRPVYWHDMLPTSAYAGLHPYTVRDFQTRRLDAESARIVADGAPLPERSLDFKILSGGADRPRFYADATVGSILSRQRLSLIRHGRRLLRSGDAAGALEAAELCQRLFPPTGWEYQVLYDADSVCHEGFELASLKIDAGKALGNRQAVKEGEALRKREKARYLQWRRYREALPPRLRNLMTPKNQRKALYKS